MSVRTRYKIEISVSSTMAEERDLGNIRWEVVTDRQGEGGGWKTLLAASATNVQIPMDSISSVRLLAIRTNAKDPNQTPTQINIRLNSISGEQIEILPLSDTKEGHFLVSGAGIASLYASNMGATDMELTLLAIGD